MSTNYRVERNPEDSDFCYFPFFEIMLTAEGKFKPCSKHGEFITDGGECVTVDGGERIRGGQFNFVTQMAPRAKLKELFAAMRPKK